VVRQAAGAVLGADQVVECAPLMASEDFAYMLEQRPGAYFFLGHDGRTCHHPGFDFDDRTLATGVAVFAEIVRRQLG
jgi:hippurate hydrolase